MSTLFGHTWEDDSCIIYTLPEDPPSYSAAQTLSQDVLLIIFTWAQTADLDDLKFSDYQDGKPWLGRTMFSQTAVPRNVSQVCRSWREVAMNNASLWSTIVAHDATPASRSPEVLKDGLKRYLTFSRDVPLKISARMSHRSSGGFSLRVFLQWLANERGRWKRVSILCFSILIPSLRFSSPILLDNLVALEEMALRFRSGHELNCSIHLDLSKCRQLRRLELDGNFLLKTDGMLLEKLTHVEFSRRVSDGAFLRQCPEAQFPTLSDCQTILRLAPSLSSITLKIRGTDVVPDESAMHLPKLEEFRLYIESPSPAALRKIHRFVDTLVIPALKALWVETTTAPYIEGLVGRSKCMLESVVIDGEECEDDESAIVEAEWLRYTPSLRELLLKQVTIDSRVLAGLVRSRPRNEIVVHGSQLLEQNRLGEEDLCLGLKHMEFEMCQFRGDREHMSRLLNTMLRSRVS